MSSGMGSEPDFASRRFSPLVPELIVHDLDQSLRFYRDVIGFRVLYAREAEGFAYLEREGAELMLERLGSGSLCVGALERPLGAGMNLQIEVSSLDPLLTALERANLRLWRAPEERWYRMGALFGGQVQFIVQDPDGYLLRFARSLGFRPAEPSDG